MMLLQTLTLTFIFSLRFTVCSRPSWANLAPQLTKQPSRPPLRVLSCSLQTQTLLYYSESDVIMIMI